MTRILGENLSSHVLRLFYFLLTTSTLLPVYGIQYGGARICQGVRIEDWGWRKSQVDDERTDDSFSRWHALTRPLPTYGFILTRKAAIFPPRFSSVLVALGEWDLLIEDCAVKKSPVTSHSYTYISLFLISDVCSVCTACTCTAVVSKRVEK